MPMILKLSPTGDKAFLKKDADPYGIGIEGVELLLLKRALRLSHAGDRDKVLADFYETATMALQLRGFAKPQTV